MAFSKENRTNTLSGIWFVSLFAFSSMYIASLPFVASIGFSPLVIAIIFGMIYANTLRHKLPAEWTPGVVFSAKTLLRTAIILYGFRITYQEIAAVGVGALIIDAIVLISTFLLAIFIGIKVFKLDKESSMLIGSGASICGAAAVLATEGVLKNEAYKTAMAVATVVLFGTISMFLYPILYKAGFFDLSVVGYGVYVGASVHEVAQVVVAGNAVSPISSDTAVIVKMTRVMMLAPFLIILGFMLARLNSSSGGEGTKVAVPWFAVWFLVVAGFNSFDLLPRAAVEVINNIDIFLLAMAMAALGIETSFAKLKAVGMKPFYLAFVLFIWLMVGGYFLTKLITPLF